MAQFDLDRGSCGCYLLMHSSGEYASFVAAYTVLRLWYAPPMHGAPAPQGASLTIGRLPAEGTAVLVVVLRIYSLCGTLIVI